MPEESSTNPSRSRGRGGRAARQRERSHRAAEVIAGIERQIPTYELLGEDGLAMIEAAADQILAEIGIEFHGDPEAHRLWREAGADISGERVRFPIGLLRSILKVAPTSFVQHARNSERSLLIGGKRVVFSPAYGSPFVQDLEGGRRYGTLTDFENFVKLAYSIPGCIIPAEPSANPSTFPSTSVTSTWWPPIFAIPTSPSWAP
jgi:trimethylamine---corrinoid protein Co-methyltransferase